MKKLYVDMEIRARELPGRLLVALVAAERGWSVVLGNQKRLKPMLWDGVLPPGVYLHNKFHPGNPSILGRVSAQGHRILVQDEEHGLLDENYEPFARRRVSQGSLAFCDRVLCWGDFDFEGLRAVYPGDAHRLIRTGSPRTDYWRPAMNGYFESEARDHVARFGRFLLLPSNLVTLHHRMGREGYIRRYFRIDPESAGASGDPRVAALDGRRAFQRQLRDAFVSLLSEIGNRYPDVQTVIRSHPIESMQDWTEAVAGLRNVHVVREGSIDGWVHASVGLIHNGCTTGFQGVIAGKPVIAYCPVESEWERRVPNLASLRCTTVPEVFGILDRVLPATDGAAGLEIGEEGRALLHQRFFGLDDRLAADRIVDVIEALEGVPDNGSLNPRALHLRSRMRDALSLRWWKRLRASDSSDSGKTVKFEPMRVAEVEAMRQSLSRALGRFGDLAIEPVDRSVVHIARTG